MIRIFDLSEARETILRRKIFGTEIPAALRASLRRVFDADISPDDAVRKILDDVRAHGDDAVRAWTQKIDGVALDSFDAPRAEWRAAYERLDADLQNSLRVAAERIRAFHARQPLPQWTTNDLGGTLGQKISPLDRVGVYVPSGATPLPSSLLMAAIPARVAGVKEIIVTTPPRKSDGAIPDVILAAAHLAGVDAVYRVGGAQAIAAMAFGTKNIPRVDKIVGPGGLFVTLAKKQLFGQVGLDGLAGPTETMIVADDSANPVWIAADLLAQAEHDILATAILVTPSHALAIKVQTQIAAQIETRARAEIIAAALDGQSGIVIAPNIDAALQIAEDFAPEHLCLSLRDAEQYASRVRHAGGIFLGERSFEVLGDYVAGPSHIMPTSGTARFASALTVLDFVRITNIIALDDENARELSPRAARLAQAESLDAHACAAMYRAQAANNSRATPAPRFLFAATESNASAPPYAAWMAKRGVIKLDANENPYGASPRARAAVRAEKNFHRYPDPQCAELRRALENFTRVPMENLIVGAGADELIDLTLRATVSPDDVVIDCPPTFGMYSIFARQQRARVIEISRRKNFGVDVDAVLTAVAIEPRAKIIFLCSPNNPDGGVLSDTDLRQILRSRLLVVLDEAYIEFADRSRIDWMREYDNLVVLRTFSKWAGLAGLRIGYAAFPKAIAARVEQIKPPYNINRAAERAAMASLQSRAYLLKNVERVRVARGKLFDALRAIQGIAPYPSEANFILCRLAGDRARKIQRELEQKKIIVRYFERAELRDCLRISVGTPRENARLIKCLREVMEK